VNPTDPYEHTMAIEKFQNLVTEWFSNSPEKGTETYNDDLLSALAEPTTLQQFSGYILMQKAKYKKCMVVYGPKDTGKSIYASLMTAIVGIENICSIPVDKMGDQHCLAPIKGKMLNLVSDLPKDALLSDGGLKQLVSGGDPIQINEKYKPQQSLIPHAKHLFVTNNLPRIVDTTNAVFERFLFLEFKNVIHKKDQNPNLLKNLLREREAILRWMIEGAIDIYKKNGRFTESRNSLKKLKEYANEQNPMHNFLEETYVFEDESSVSIAEVRDDFREYCGNSRITSRKVGSVIRDLGYKVEVQRVGGVTQRMALGFRKAVT